MRVAAPFRNVVDLIDDFEEGRSCLIIPRRAAITICAKGLRLNFLRLFLLEGIPSLVYFSA